MPYVITAACLDNQDRSCVEVCPVDCIHEASRMLAIDPEECIDCNACVQACPVEAIYADDELPDDQVVFIEINAAITRGPAAVDAAVVAWEATSTAATTRPVDAS